MTEGRRRKKKGKKEVREGRREGGKKTKLSTHFLCYSFFAMFAKT